MNDHRDETEFRELERRARAAFDASVESVDAQARSRLNQARHRAVETVSVSLALRFEHQFVEFAHGEFALPATDSSVYHS